MNYVYFKGGKKSHVFILLLPQRIGFGKHCDVMNGGVR